VEGRAVHSQDALGSWTLEDNTFLGPIGSDGISIVDFGGSGFRIAGSSFQTIGSYGVHGRDSVGSWTLEDNIFSGRIELDGVMLNRVGSDGQIRRNDVREVVGNGMSLLHLGGQEQALGSWTLEDNTFLGPVGYDGISVTGFVGQSIAVSDNSLTGTINGRGILVTGSTGAVTMEDNTVSNTSGDGVVVSGFSVGANLNFNRNDINGARGLAVRLNNMGGSINADRNQFRNTRTSEQGGHGGAHASGLGLQATEVRSMNLSNNTLEGNLGGGLVVDLQAWSEVDELLEVDAQQVSVVLQNNTVINPAGNLPSYALQNLPEGAQVAGNNAQDADPELRLERSYAAREGCGDGLPEPPEACDDGNLDVNDGCAPDCTLEEGGQIQIALGDRFTCYLNPDANDPLRCWGDNASGQMGLEPARGHEDVQAIRVGPANEDWEVVHIATGSFHVCALAEYQSERRVFCWGRSDYGQTGHRTEERNCTDIDEWRNERGGEGEPCTNHEDCNGGLVCWDGRFCTPDPSPMRCTFRHDVPVKMDDEEDLEAVYSVTAGRRHSCALVRLSGRRSVVCWGAYEQRQQGIWPDDFGIFDGNDPDEVPNEFDNGPDLIDTRGHEVYMQGVEPHQLVTGNDFNCVLDVAGRAYCWGANNVGQLGRGNPDVIDAEAEVDPNDGGRVLPVATDERFQVLAAGNDHVCGVTVRMEIFCWGNNARGQMGLGGGLPPELQIVWVPEEPVDAPGGAVMSLDAGGGHTVVLDAYEREVPRTWGDNRWNQVGNPMFGEEFSHVGHTTPIMTEDRLRSRLVRVGAGGRHSCAVDSAGDVVCWGDNSKRQCSAFRGDDRLPEPTRLEFR
ncbi:MAG TPA: hypothetical protein DEB46_06950, partial [Myxococcales bacterium]|nr:hypothetical protein [Myxococcales bacterium]